MREPNLKPCPDCGEKAFMQFEDRVACSSELCLMLGPFNDHKGAKWNALPRRSDLAVNGCPLPPGDVKFTPELPLGGLPSSPVNMSDGELIARAIGNVGALLARAIRPEAFDDASSAACEEEGKRLDAELDRRAAARKVAP